MLRFHEIRLDAGDPVLCRRCAPVPVGQEASPAGADVSAVIRAAIEDPFCGGVIFTGADPAGYPDIDGLISRAARAGVPRVALRTVGGRLAEPGRASALIAAGARIFEVPFLGSCASMHDALCSGEAEAFEAGIQGVRLLLDTADQAGVRVAVRGLVRVCAHTVSDLPATVTSLAQVPVTSVVLASPPGDEARRHLEWIGAACDTGTVNRVWVSVRGIAPELLGERALHANDPISTGGAA